MCFAGTQRLKGMSANAPRNAHCVGQSSTAAATALKYTPALSGGGAMDTVSEEKLISDLEQANAPTLSLPESSRNRKG